jgi:hypothetical protein
MFSGIVTGFPYQNRPIFDAFATKFMTHHAPQAEFSPRGFIGVLRFGEFLVTSTVNILRLLNEKKGLRGGIKSCGFGLKSGFRPRLFVH